MKLVNETLMKTISSMICDEELVESDEDQNRIDK